MENFVSFRFSNRNVLKLVVCTHSLWVHMADCNESNPSSPIVFGYQVRSRKIQREAALKLNRGGPQRWVTSVNTGINFSDMGLSR